MARTSVIALVRQGKDDLKGTARAEVQMVVAVRRVPSEREHFCVIFGPRE